MASRQRNSAETEQTTTGKEIQASVDRSQTALNRLDNVVKQQAQRGLNPKQTQDYWNALINVDMAVLDAFDRMRKYLVYDKEDEYWNRHIIGIDSRQAVLLGSRDHEVDRDDLVWVGALERKRAAIETDSDQVQLAFLEDYEGGYESYQRRERERFGDPKVTTEYVPKVLAPNDYRRVHRILDEARRDLGFTPTPQNSTPRTEITQEMIDDIEEWRQESLPQQYLDNGK